MYDSGGVEMIHASAETVAPKHAALLFLLVQNASLYVQLL